MRQPRKVSVFPPKPEDFRFMWSTPLESRHQHVLLEALKSLASLFQKGRLPVKQMEPITGGAGPGYYRSSHGRGETGRKESSCLFFTSLWPILMCFSPLAVWASKSGQTMLCVCEFSRDLAKHRPGLISPTHGQVCDSSSSSALGSQRWWVIVLSCQVDELLKHLTIVNSFTYMWPVTCPGYRPSGGQGHKQKSRVIWWDSDSMSLVKVHCLVGVRRFAFIKVTRIQEQIRNPTGISLQE